MRNTWPPLLKRACSFPQGSRTDPRELATGGPSSLEAAGAIFFCAVVGLGGCARLVDLSQPHKCNHRQPRSLS